MQSHPKAIQTIKFGECTVSGDKLVMVITASGQVAVGLNAQRMGQLVIEADIQAVTGPVELRLRDIGVLLHAPRETDAGAGSLVAPAGLDIISGVDARGPGTG